MSGDYDDLLSGLGSDDLNDFDFEEGGVQHEDDLAQAQEYDEDLDKTLAEGSLRLSLVRTRRPDFRSLSRIDNLTATHLRRVHGFQHRSWQRPSPSICWSSCPRPSDRSGSCRAPGINR